jgi:hypothetical protein
MHLYWRVEQDLRCLGEIIHFHDPCLLRCRRQWQQRNAGGIALAEDPPEFQWLRPSLN